MCGISSKQYNTYSNNLHATLDTSLSGKRNANDMNTISEGMLIARLSQSTCYNSTSSTNLPSRMKNNQYSAESSLANANIKCCWKNCGLYFESLEFLGNHLLKIHANSRPSGLYYCEWEGCTRNKGFTARYKMLVHARTHTNEKPHHCYLCSKSFSRAENLKIHKRSHNGEKPYICPVLGCNKAYSNSSDRFKHTKTHQVEKPYICKIPGCSKRYTDPSSLRKHAKTYKHYTCNQLLEQTRTQHIKPDTPNITQIIADNAANFTNFHIRSYSYAYPAESCMSEIPNLLTFGALIDYNGAHIENMTWRKWFEPFTQHFKLEDNRYIDEHKNIELPLDLTVNRK